MPGTRNGPHEILVASSHMELWDEETETDVHGIGIFTLPEMEFPFATMDEVMSEIRRVASELVSRDKFPVVLGGEHSITAPVVGALSRRNTRASRCCRSTRTPTCATRSWERRTTTPARCAGCSSTRAATQVGIRSLSPEEAAAAPSLPTTIFYDFNMRQDPNWMDRVVDSLSETVYITIDCDGFDPAIMPAAGTPEPGGLSWYEALALLRRVIETRKVVGCDLVELSPMPGNVAPNFLCAKLIYKILSYRFGARDRAPDLGRLLQALRARACASPLNGDSGNSSTSRLNVCWASARLPASR